jgi:23S rRNA (uracil1939-C5)-methyltransferase
MLTSELLTPGCMEACPACPHRTLTMEESLSQKRNWLLSRLSPFSDQMEAVNSVGASQRLHYRDKVCLHAEYTGAAWKIGVMKRGSVIPIPECPVHSDRVNAFLGELLLILPGFEDFPLKYYVHSAAQVSLVCKSSTLPRPVILNRLKALARGHSGIEGLWLHLHPSAGFKVFGKGGWHLLEGEPFSVDESGLRYGPAAFQQLLPGLYGQSMGRAASFLRPSEETVVIDLYSGTGSSLRRWVEHHSACLGVEISGDAIEQASVNVTGTPVLRGTCKQRLPQLDEFINSEENEQKIKLLYANPPRTGLEKEVADWIIHTLEPERIAYLSCSAGTLRRDLDTLVKGHYLVERLIPYDFFPQTKHIEVLSLLQKQ